MDTLNTPTVAIVTFTDARDEGISSEAVESHLRTKQEELALFLSQNGIEVVDPLEQLGRGSRSWCARVPGSRPLRSRSHIRR